MKNVPKFTCLLSDPADSESREAIYDGLNEFNVKTLGRKSKKILLVVKDNDGNVCGGLDAAMMPDSMYIAALWLKEEVRGHNIGTKLMEMAEQSARKYGCENIILDTYTFQAEPFYQKLGYTRIAVVEKMLLGHDRIFLKKDLI